MVGMGEVAEFMYHNIFLCRQRRHTQPAAESQRAGFQAAGTPPGVHVPHRNAGKSTPRAAGRKPGIVCPAKGRHLRQGFRLGGQRRVGGCIGETSAIALLIGFGILLWKDIIKWHIPVVYVATVAVLSMVFGRPVSPLYEVLSGGLLLGAIFMATDYVTTPVTRRGQIIFAVGCGVLATLIRTWGGYPEGVSYSILIMNLVVPLIDRATKPHIFGEVKKHA